MKKIISMLCMFAVVCSCAVFLSGCGDDEMTVMNVSLNPQVEFVLDDDDKVVSVSALNEEGNLIINGQVFVGKTAQEAVELFVSISTATGYIVSGDISTDENQISISFSGDKKEAEKLYKSIKNNVQKFLEESGITATINKTADLGEDYLRAQVQKVMPYLEKAKINAMEYDELIENLEISRKETAEIYSQAIKDSYYQAKAYAVQTAKFEVIKQQLNSVTGVMLETALNTYKLATNAIETARNSYFLADNSIYQVAMSTLRQAKVDYLNYRNYVAGLEQNQVTTAITTQLDNYKSALELAEQNLETVYNQANNALDTANQQVNNSYNAVINIIQNLSININDYLSGKEGEINTAIETFTTDFEQNYKTLIDQSKANLDAMKNQLVSQE